MRKIGDMSKRPSGASDSAVYSVHQLPIHFLFREVIQNALAESPYLRVTA